MTRKNKEDVGPVACFSQDDAGTQPHRSVKEKLRDIVTHLEQFAQSPAGDSGSSAAIPGPVQVVVVEGMGAAASPAWEEDSTSWSLPDGAASNPASDSDFVSSLSGLYYESNYYM